jgi:hypothetical protein
VPRNATWPWKKPRQKTIKAPLKLTPAKKTAARKRAQEAGRRYPNLIDTMWALKQPQ